MQEIVKGLKSHHILYEDLAHDLRDDLHIATEAIKINEANFQYMGDNLMSNVDFCSFILEIIPQEMVDAFISYVSLDCFNDPGFVLRIYDISGDIGYLGLLGSHLFKNKKFIIRLSKRLNIYHEGCLDEFINDPVILRDKELMFYLYHKHFITLDIICRELWQDVDFVMDLMDWNIDTFPSFPLSVRANKEICMYAMKKNHKIYPFIDIELRIDDDILKMRRWRKRQPYVNDANIAKAIERIKMFPNNYFHLPIALRIDRSVILTAAQYGVDIQYMEIPYSLMDNIDFMISISRIDIRYMGFVSDNVMSKI